MSDSNTLTNWWQEQELPPGALRCWSLGLRRLWVQRQGQDLGLWSESCFEEPTQPGCQTPEQAPEQAQWQPWIFNQEELFLRLLPALPTVSVLLRPQQALSLAPHARLRLFIGIPAVLQLQARIREPRGAESWLTLHESPCITLSQTWFGDNTAGELCQALPSRARRCLEEIEPRPHRILCPVEISNQSSAPFVFERACVRVPHCCTWQGERHLWASAVHITYRGADHDTLVEIENHPPAEAAQGQLLCAARIPQEDGGRRFSLAGLRGSWMSA